MGKLSLSTDTSNTPLLLVIRKAYLDVQMVKNMVKEKIERELMCFMVCIELSEPF